MRFDSSNFLTNDNNVKINKSHNEILEQVYTLQVTDNKRKLIYNEDNVLVNTEHYEISESKTIKS